MPDFYDNLSLERLSKLHPKVRDEATALVKKAWSQGLRMRVTHGLRSMDEQQKLYNKGRTTPGAIVTYAKPGRSYHNYGLALDFCLLNDAGKAIFWIKADLNNDRRADWSQIVDIFKAAGWEWGGNFKQLKDYPHLQKTFGYTTRQLEAKWVQQQGPYPEI